jgi:hypothetical protein
VTAQSASNYGQAVEQAAKLWTSCVACDSCE